MQIKNAVMILAVVTVFVAGCTSTAQRRMVKSNAEKKAQVLRVEAQGLKDILLGLPVAVEPEPVQDISHGTYLGRIQQISTGTSKPAFLIDFVTPEMIPGTTAKQRRRSSWPNYFGWNKTKHVQRFPLGRNATLITSGLRFVVMSSKDFAINWTEYPESEKIVYYFIIRHREIDAIWPWVP